MSLHGDTISCSQPAHQMHFFFNIKQTNHIYLSSRCYYLDVFANHIEAEVLGLLEVPEQRGLAGRGEQPVRPVALQAQRFSGNH